MQSMGKIYAYSTYIAEIYYELLNFSTALHNLRAHLLHTNSSGIASPKKL